MKKLITLFAALLAVLNIQAKEETIFTGPAVVAGYAGISIPAADLATVEVGDVIKVKVSDIRADGYNFLVFLDAGGTKLTNSDQLQFSNSSIYGVSLIVSSEHIDKLKSDGLQITGDGYTIDRVVLDRQPAEKVVLYGPIAMSEDGSGAYSFPDALKFQLNTAQAGDKLTVYATTNSSSRGAIQNMDWSSFAPEVDFVGFTDKFSLTLTDEILSDMRSRGFRLRGMSYTLDSLVISAQGAAPSEPGGIELGGTTLFEGPFAVAGYAGISIPASSFAGIEAGDVVKVSTSSIRSDGYNFIVFLDAGGSKFSSSNQLQFNNSSIFGASFIVSSEHLDKIKEGGMQITGDGFTIDRVVLDKQPGRKVVLYGPIAMSDDGSGGYRFPLDVLKFQFNTVKTGDILTIHASNITEESQGAINNVDWSPINPAYSYFGIKGDYDITLTAEILSEMTTRGFLIRGKQYTVDSVSVSSVAREYETVVVDETGYLAFSHPHKMFDFTAVDGLQASTVKVNGNALAAADLNAAIPAGTGVLLKAAQGEYSVPIAGEATAPADNDLVAYTAGDALNGYFLAVGEDLKPVFKLNASFTPEGNGAYIPAAKATGEELAFEEPNTGIRQANGLSAATRDVVFDLQGRRVSSIPAMKGSQKAKGVYIVNGKKIVVR